MARAKREIRTEAFIHVGGRLVNVDALNEAQRDYVGAMLRRQLLNAAFAGRAEFESPELPDFGDVPGEIIT